MTNPELALVAFGHVACLAIGFVAGRLVERMVRAMAAIDEELGGDDPSELDGHHAPHLWPEAAGSLAPSRQRRSAGGESPMPRPARR